MSLRSLARPLCVRPEDVKTTFLLTQGNVEKVVVVIKDKDEVALERFIFSIQSMVAVESFNKDTRLELSSPACPCHMSSKVKTGRSRSIEGAMATAALGQYFRSFMVKLGMIESQLAELPRGGVLSP